MKKSKSVVSVSKKSALFFEMLKKTYKYNILFKKYTLIFKNILKL